MNCYGCNFSKRNQACPSTGNDNFIQYPQGPEGPPGPQGPMGPPGPRNVVNLRVFASKKQHDTKQLSLLLQIIAPQIGLLIFKQSHILLVVVLFKCSFSYGCNISGVYVFGICRTFCQGG